MSSEQTQRFIVLGASGWLAHYLIPLLSTLKPDCEVFAYYRSRPPSFKDSRIRVIQIPTHLETLPKGTLINLNRGEDDSDFENHRNLIALQNQRGSRYLYASSFNAVDSNLSTPHSEEESANARTFYGMFKARCETVLLEECKRPLAFRFAATHGWAPNREARTQAFLQKLAAGEMVKVDIGIQQNRSFIGDLALQIGMLATSEKLEGIFHLGTADASEELFFLKKLAAAFGYNPEKVVEGSVNECNAIMLMPRFKQAFPDFIIPKEADTILKVSLQPELQIFKHRI